ALPERKFPLDPEPAPEFISHLASQHPHEIILAATGPLTNIAQAFQSHPQLPKLLSRMILMGGAYRITPFGRGNKTPLAEFNIWQDPEAAFTVFTSGIDITAIGLDVSANPEVCLNNKHLNQLEAGHSPSISLAIQLAEYAIQHHGCCELHDPLALASLLDPSLFSFMSVPVEIITTNDEERGMTRILPLGPGSRMPSIHLAIDVDEARFIQLFLSRVFGR
ncbi:MAG: nucleoside hydrolase, partial [Chloroflexota bacterium]|nr:nucleoside hydrolase [Chloroflexota bacterium]